MLQPDLLSETPQCRINRPLLERALVFGFSSGDTNRVFETALEHAQLPASTFEASAFERDLFLQEFVTRCAAPATGKHANATGYVLRMLCAPPPEAATSKARQRVLQALTASAPLRGALRDLQSELCQLRELLSAADFSARVDPNQRRLDVLRSFSRAVGLMAAFAGCGCYLERIATYGALVASSAGFAELTQLLAFEQGSATLDIQVSLGMDGSVRGFDVVRYQAHAHPALRRSFWARTWRALSLMLRGQKLSEHEILSRLLFTSFEALKEFMPPLFQLIGDIEFYLAALAFKDFCASRGQVTSYPTFLEQPGRCHWRGLYNPFLLAEGIDVKSCDVSAATDAIVVLTGPNSGGKTRLMQSVALAQLLAHAGWPIPASDAQVYFTGGLFVSMLDDVRADQSEGRLGMELLRIRRMFEQVCPGDLVFIDELCSGTNPSEGEEIFQLVLQLLEQLGPQVWLSTHFLQFASRLAAAPEASHLQFLRVALDAKEQPTFGFEAGVASTSLARQTAARLGVSREELSSLVERARTRRHAIHGGGERK